MVHYHSIVGPMVHNHGKPLLSMVVLPQNHRKTIDSDGCPQPFHSMVMEWKYRGTRIVTTNMICDYGLWSKDPSSWGFTSRLSSLHPSRCRLQTSQRTGALVNYLPLSSTSSSSWADASETSMPQEAEASMNLPMRNPNGRIALQISTFSNKWTYSRNII